MAGRHYHLSNGSLFLTWLIAAVIILLLPQAMTSRVWDVFRITFNPLLKIGRNTGLAGPSMPDDPDQTITQEKYHELWKDYNNLKVTLEKFKEDYEKLSQVRSNIPRQYSGLVLAQVIGTNTSRTHEVIIDKGGNDKIKVGQYVLSNRKNSIIGVIRKTSELHASVRMLTDTDQTIEILILLLI